MIKRLLFAILVLLISLNIYALEKDTLSFRKAAFIENKNQWSNQVLYKAPISTGNLWIEKNTLIFDIKNPEDIKAIAEYKSEAGTNNEKGLPFPTRMRHHVYKVHFVGANTKTLIKPINAYEAYENYFIGNDKKKWAKNVKTYHAIEYIDLYPGINLKCISMKAF